MNTLGEIGKTRLAKFFNVKLTQKAKFIIPPLSIIMDFKIIHCIGSSLFLFQMAVSRYLTSYYASYYVINRYRTPRLTKISEAGF